MMCDSKELIVGYIYGELSSDGTRGRSNAHLAVCADCRVEIEELRSTRTHLALWAPPEPDLGFRVIRGGSAPAPALPRRFAARCRRSRLPPPPRSCWRRLRRSPTSRSATAAMAAGRAGWARSGSPSAAPRSATGAGTRTAQPVRTADVGRFRGARSRACVSIESALTAGCCGQCGAAGSTARMSDAEMLRRVRADRQRCARRGRRRPLRSVCCRSSATSTTSGAPTSR